MDLILAWNKFEKPTKKIQKKNEKNKNLVAPWKHVRVPLMSEITLQKGKWKSGFPPFHNFLESQKVIEWSSLRYKEHITAISFSEFFRLLGEFITQTDTKLELSV